MQCSKYAPKLADGVASSHSRRIFGSPLAGHGFLTRDSAPPLRPPKHRNAAKSQEAAGIVPVGSEVTRRRSTTGACWRRRRSGQGVPISMSVRSQRSQPIEPALGTAGGSRLTVPPHLEWLLWGESGRTFEKGNAQIQRMRAKLSELTQIECACKFHRAVCAHTAHAPLQAYEN